MLDNIEAGMAFLHTIVWSVASCKYVFTHLSEAWPRAGSPRCCAGSRMKPSAALSYSPSGLVLLLCLLTKVSAADAAAIAAASVAAVPSSAFRP